MLQTSQTNQSVWDKRLAAGARKLVRDMSDAGDIDGERFFQQEQIDDVKKEFRLMHGIGFAQHMPEGTEPQPDTPQVGHAKLCTLTQYGLATTFTRLATKLTPELITNTNMDLVDSERKSKELWYANFYRYSIDGATVPSVGNRPIVDNICEDGLEYFHGSHTFRGSGQTNSNLQSAALTTLNVSAIVTMAQQARGWKAYDGMPKMSKIKSLVVGDNLVEKANVLVKTVQDPESNHNALNTLKFVDSGQGLNKVEHWTMMPTTDFMLRLSVPKNRPGWLILWLEKRRAINYQSVSGERRSYGYSYCGWVGGINPLEYITNRAAEA